MNISLVGLALAVNLLRGTPKLPSLINIDKCGTLDWSILLGFMAFAISCTVLATTKVKKNQALKRKLDGELLKGTVNFSGNSLYVLLIGSFAGGICAALGLGGGVVFNPLLLSLEVLPQVVTASAMYMILFSTFSGTLVYLSIGTLLGDYAILIGLMSTIGIVFALKVV
jgi:uncharacterized membrane protein YfcA